MDFLTNRYINNDCAFSCKGSQGIFYFERETSRKWMRAWLSPLSNDRIFTILISLLCYANNVALQWGGRGRIDFYARVARSILPPNDHIFSLRPECDHSKIWFWQWKRLKINLKVVFKKIVKWISEIITVPDRNVVLLTIPRP